MYNITLDHYSDHIATIIRSIIKCQPGGVIIHCHSGKDRTGIIAALLLGVVGVPNEQIVADYAETQIWLQPLFDEQVKKAKGEENLGFWQRATATSEMMQLMLEHIERKYGGVKPYLKQAGLSIEEIKQLKERLTTTKE